jgi:hypothetical protein
MADILQGQEWLVITGDCIEEMPSFPAESVDHVVCSVPFPSMFAYTSLENDLGNSEDLGPETRIHFSFFFRQLARLLKPGRVACIHCMQIPRMKRAGGRGLMDFRGLLIRLGERAGLTYEYDWLLRVNPQEQALRTKSRELQFAGLESDRAKSRGALCEYLIKFVAPGDNEVAVDSEGEVSRNDWISWAEGAWADIKRTDTLNIKGTKDDCDTRHICPLALPTIRRSVKLYTNPGEIVFSPFAGIGSEVRVAVEEGRRALGIELKPSWADVARGHCARAEEARRQARQADLFAWAESQAAEGVAAP